MKPFTANQDYWGHELKPKADSCIRLAFRNINFLPQYKSGTKNSEVMFDIRNASVDIFGMCETNVAWHLVDESDSPHECFRGFFESMKVAYSNNTTEKEDKQIGQVGGTMLLTIENVTNRVLQSGSDPTNLGRWSWVLLQGKDQRKLRVVSIYRPVISSGPTAVYQQHLRYFRNQGLEVCPRQKFFIDLQLEIKKWIECGEQIVIMGDFNEDVRSSYINNYFKQFGMTEIITNQHGTNAPNTYARGQIPIDGIFATQTLAAVLSGYSPLYWGTGTDHRMVWVDLDSTIVFGDTISELWHPKRRRLTLQDPCTVERFLLHRKTHMKSCNLVKEVKQLYSSIVDKRMSAAQQEYYEYLDQLRVEGILTADKRCRKLKTGSVPWSPIFQKSINNIQYLRVCIKRLSGMNVNSRTLLRLFKKSSLGAPITSLEDALQLIKTEFQQYQIVKKAASNNRFNFLSDLAMAIAEDEGTEYQSVYKQLIRREKLRELGRKLKSLTGKLRSKLVKVAVPTGNKEWKETEGKLEMEKGCIEENIRRFTQANHTPSLKPEIIDKIGWTGNTSFSDQILNNSANVQDLHPHIQELIPFLSKPDSITAIGDISTIISAEDYKYSWKRVRAKTSSGRSGLHFGHFIASCQDPDMVEVDRLLLEIPFMTGYAPSHWIVGIDCMIPKKVDSLRVDELRTILLFEADCNHLFKIFGRRLMAHAEKANSIASEQFGSRKRKSMLRVNS
jgi:endonuclease/exonuclease/phosphatase family metal-dependent hydrolase